MSEAEGQAPPLTGGALRSAISQALVRIYADYYGKGATQAKTYEFDNVVVTILRDVFTTVEQTLIEHGKPGAVHALRAEFQAAYRQTFIDAVERLTGRKVESFMSQVDPAGNVAAETFILADPGEDGI